MFRTLELSFLLLLIPLSFFTVMFKIPSYVPGYVIIALIIIGLHLRDLRVKEYFNISWLKSNFRVNKLTLLIVLFICLISLSTFLSIDPTKTLRGLALVFLLIVLVYLLYYRNLNQGSVALFLKVLLVTVIMVQVFYIIFKFIGFAAPSFLRDVFWFRIYYFFISVNTNIYGAMISFSFPALVKLYFIAKPKDKLKYIAIGLFLLLDLFFLRSRASMLMVLTYGFILFGFYYQKSFKYMFKVFISALLLVIATISFWPQKIKVFLKINYGLNARDLLWQKGLEYVQQKPLFGFGFRTVPEVQLDNLTLNLHNIYLAMAVEIGILATISFIVLTLYYLYICTKNALLITNKVNRFIAFSCIAFLISVMVHHSFEQMLFFFGNQYFTNVYFLIYLAILNSIVFKGKEFDFKEVEDINLKRNYPNRY